MRIGDQSHENTQIEEYLPKINNIDSRGAHKDVYPFTPQEKAKIIHKSSGTIRAIVSLVFNTGIRSSEWVALKKTDVCLKTKQIYTGSQLGKEATPIKINHFKKATK